MGPEEPILNAEGAPGVLRYPQGGKGDPFLVLLQAQFNHLPPGRPVMAEVWDCREPSKTKQLLSPRARRPENITLDLMPWQHQH